MEYLDIVDENGNPTGETAERTVAHARGLRHLTCYVWLLRQGEGRVQVLLQKRSRNKDGYPGCYDISSAGHIPAGVDWEPSALRELKVELGLTARPQDLILCGVRRFQVAQVFHGKSFHDNQVSRVYDMLRDVEPEEMTLQESEVESVRWMDYETCLAEVTARDSNYCIFPEELAMLRRAFPQAGEREDSKLWPS